MILLFVKQKEEKGTLRSTMVLHARYLPVFGGDELNFTCFAEFIYEASVRILFYLQLKLRAGEGE